MSYNVTRITKHSKHLRRVNKYINFLGIVIASVCLILLGHGNLRAQNSRVDSLKQLLNNSDNASTQIKALVKLSVAYDNINSDTMLIYAKRAYALVDDKTDTKVQADVTNQLGLSYYSAGRYDTAKAMFRKYLDMSQKQKYAIGIINAYANIGNCYLRTADYINALAYYDSSKNTAIAAKDARGIARASSNIGSIMHEQGKYESALRYYMDGLKYYEQTGSLADIEMVVLNLCNVYYRIGDYAMAKDCLRRAEKLAKQTDSKWNEISVLTTYALIYDSEGKPDSSLIVVQKALKVSAVMNNPYLTNVLTGNMAEAYLDLGMNDSAYKYYTQSYKLSERINDNEGKAFAEIGLGEIYIRKGNSAKGISLLKSGLAVLQANSMKEEAGNASEQLAKALAASGNYKEAYQYEVLSQSYSDSMNKEKAMQTARNLEFEYELEKQQELIKNLEQDNAVAEGKTRLNRILFSAAALGMFLAIIIAIQFFRNLRRARAANELILQQKNEIECQAKKLEELNKFKDTTFSVLSHDLRSPINALTGTMAMLDAGIITPEEFALHKQELDNKLQSVTLMLDNLLQWAKSQMKGEHTLDIERINVKRKVLKSFAVMKDAAQQKGIALTHKVPEELYVSADRNQMAMVMRNLLSNAIKFTPDGGTVQVAATGKNGKVEIAVSDNGVGMTKIQASQLFDGTPNQSTAGTVGEKGTGIGLSLSGDFIRNNGGAIRVDSEKGRGTTFTIELPMA